MGNSLTLSSMGGSLPPQNLKNLLRPLNQFRLSQDFRTFPKYVLETPWIIKKMTNFFFARGKKIIIFFTLGGWNPPPPGILFRKKRRGSIRVNRTHLLVQTFQTAKLTYTAFYLLRMNIKLS